MHTVKDITPFGAGRWLVSYTVPAPCGCYFDRKTVVISAKKKPTQKQIDNAIKDQEKSG